MWSGLKLFHALAGVFWTGSVVFVAAYLLPVVRGLGPGGGPVMKAVLARRMPATLHLAGAFTLLTGLFLYAHVTAGFRIAPWAGPSRPFLFAGALCGVLGVAWGILYQGRLAARLERTTAAIQGPPSPEQAMHIRNLQERMQTGAVVAAVLLMLALAGMVLSHPV